MAQISRIMREMRDHGGQEGRVGRWPAVKSSELTHRLTDASISPNPLIIRVARVIRGSHSVLQVNAHHNFDAKMYFQRLYHTSLFVHKTGVET